MNLLGSRIDTETQLATITFPLSSPHRFRLDIFALCLVIPSVHPLDNIHLPHTYSMLKHCFRISVTRKVKGPALEDLTAPLVRQGIHSQKQPKT